MFHYQRSKYYLRHQMLHVSKQRAKRSTMKSATSVSCCPLSVKVLWLVPVPLREATTCKQIKRCCLSRSQENTTASVWHQSSVPANWEIGLVSASPTCGVVQMNVETSSVLTYSLFRHNVHSTVRLLQKYLQLVCASCLWLVTHICFPCSSLFLSQVFFPWSAG